MPIGDDGRVFRLPASTVLRDVSLRDGLQDEPPISLDAKLEIFEALVSAGVAELELTSFVRPDRVPAMADGEAFCAATDGADVIRWGLVLNRRGAERALAAGLNHLQYVISVSDTHSRHNATMSTDDALVAFDASVAPALEHGAEVEVTLSTAFGCPYEGRVDPDRVVGIARRVVAAGATGIGLADTIGVAVPDEVARLVGDAVAELGVPVGLHLHDTRGLGVANALIGLEHGASRLDAAVGGLGGCPFAPGASGNVAIEDLAYALGEMGVDTGCSVPALMRAAELACGAVGRSVGSHVGVAGPRFV